MSREDQTDLDKEVVQLRLRLHHAESQVEQLRAAFSLNTTIVREFVMSSWRSSSRRQGMLQRMTEERDGLQKELQDTREDLDRVNETLAKLFKTRL